MKIIFLPNTLQTGKKGFIDWDPADSLTKTVRESP